MKKIFTLIIALAFIGTQMASAQILKLGVKGGVNTKAYDFDSFTVGGATISPGANGNIGYSGGVVLKISIPKFVYIQPELRYAGGDYDYVISSGNYSSKVRMDYQRFELPVMVGFNIKSLRFFGGPKFILASSASSSNNAIDFKVDYVNTDVAFEFGCGFDIKRFFIDISYTTYFSDNYDKLTYNGSTTSVKLKEDSQWNFNVGFFF